MAALDWSVGEGGVAGEFVMFTRFFFCCYIEANVIFALFHCVLKSPKVNVLRGTPQKGLGSQN